MDVVVILSADPDRAKSDKGSIITDTIQVLKDLNSEVKKLNTEHQVLCEESREVNYASIRS